MCCLDGTRRICGDRRSAFAGRHFSDNVGRRHRGGKRHERRNTRNCAASLRADFARYCRRWTRLLRALAFYTGILDTDAKGSDAKGIAVRVVFAVIGLVYLGLSFSAVKILLGTTRSDSDFWAQSWTAWLLAQPYGQWLVGLAAVIAAAIGIGHIYIACATKFRENLKLSEMSDSQKKWGTRFAIVGFAARGVVFCIVGFFLAFAAWQSNAGEVHDFGSALRILEQKPYRVWLLDVIAVGLFSYGIFMFFQARFRQIVKIMKD